MSTLLTELPDAAVWPLPPAGIPMQTHAWIQAKLELTSPFVPRQLFAVADSYGVQAIAPLLRVGDWLREPPAMFEPSDFAWSNAESLLALAHDLARQPLPIYLERLPATSLTLHALRRAYARRGMVLVRPAMPTPVIRLEGRGTDSDAWFNAGRRSDFRRAERLASSFGTVSYAIHAPGSGTELAELLDEIYAVEARSWKAAEGTALATSAIQGDFFVRFSQAAASQGMLRVAFLRIDGRAVAMQIACEWQQRFWLFKISYDQSFARCSPGQLLLRHTLRHAAATGLLSYELMGIMDDWTTQWTQNTRDFLQVRVIPFSGTTIKMATKTGARAAINRLRRITR